VWCKKDRDDKVSERLGTLEAAISTFRRRLRNVKRDLDLVKSDQRKFERELLLKLGRLEGVLGIGLGGVVEGVETTNTTRPGLEFEKRRQEEEAERLALEQLGTGGSAQSVLDPIVNHEEEEE
jgi:hypothetical protein